VISPVLLTVKIESSLLPLNPIPEGPINTPLVESLKEALLFVYKAVSKFPSFVFLTVKPAMAVTAAPTVPI
jgi:hypothetical protein